LKSFKKTAIKLREHIGETVSVWPADTMVFNYVYEFPKKVSIIVNGYCASSTELFLLKALQSSKVKLFGETTLGAVDYADALTLTMPCRFYALSYSTSRTNRPKEQAIDYIGIKPHFEISNEVKDWVEYIRLLNR
jgi:C-terminal processing protease CtpA/Prc